MAVTLRRTVTTAGMLAASFAFAAKAPAAQTTMSISSTPAPALPRVLAPLTVSAFPSSPFLFRIAATGQSPLAFSATSLPNGLTLAADTGIISGTTPTAGTYSIDVKVANSVGSASATLIMVSGNSLCMTPPVGWNSYDSFGASITESEVIGQANALKSQLQPYGWNTVVIDYRWYEPENAIDANGRYLPSKSKYPSATGSNGFKTLADQVHAMGLHFGIHIMRGIPRSSYTANTPIANSTYKAQDAGNTSDPCPWDTHMWGVRGDTTAGQDWYDSIVSQYAQWGVDFIKVDDMINNNTVTYHQSEVDALQKSIQGSGRSIVLSLSPGPMRTANAADLNGNANMWRMVNDFWDYNGLSTLSDVFTAAGNWQAVTSLTVGHWPDGDMLPLGYLGPRNEWHASGQTTFSKNEQVTIMSLWSIIASPLIYGGNVASLAADSWTMALLTNEEVMAVNQDSSGTHGKRVVQQGTTEVWTRDLTGGRKAVALFNRGTQDATVTASFSQLGVAGIPRVRDLWNRADVTGMTTGLSATVPYSGALMYALNPAGAATGGAAGLGGTSSTGASAASGGAGAIGGMVGVGGTRASGGTNATTGGTLAATGGRTSSYGGGIVTSGGRLATGGSQSATTASTGGVAWLMTGGSSNASSLVPATGGTSLGGVGGGSGTGLGSLGGTPAIGGNASTAGTTIGGIGAASSAGTISNVGSDTGSCSCRVSSSRGAPLGRVSIALVGLAFAARRRNRSTRVVPTKL